MLSHMTSIIKRLFLFHIICSGEVCSKVFGILNISNPSFLGSEGEKHNMCTYSKDTYLSERNTKQLPLFLVMIDLTLGFSSTVEIKNKQRNQLDVKLGKATIIVTLKVWIKCADDSFPVSDMKQFLKYLSFLYKLMLNIFKVYLKYSTYIYV